MQPCIKWRGAGVWSNGSDWKSGGKVPSGVQIPPSGFKIIYLFRLFLALFNSF